MIFAVYDFTPLKDELPEFNLKLLLNIEDLNNSIFNEVFISIKPHQQEQYIAFRGSEEAQKYRKQRNAELPYVDFSNLPEVFDHELLQKIMLHQKDGEVRRAVYDSLSEQHKLQIAQYEWKIYDEEKAKKRALMSEEEKRKEKEWWDKYNSDPTPRFMGNMGEPGNADEYVLRYGINPFTKEPETVKSFYEKYTIDPHGNIIPKESNE